MLPFRRSFTKLITFSLLVSSGFADTIFLKNGEKIEGRIIKEDDQQLILEVKVSAGITDERIVPKPDVDRIEKVAPEAVAYKPLATLQTSANSYSIAQYDAMIEPLQAFVTQFPSGLHAADAKKALNELTAEKKRVEDGELKLRGRWLDKEEADKERVQLGGMLAFEYMKSQSAGGDGIGALNTFAAIQKNYPGAAIMPDSIELARQIIASLKPAVENAIPTQKAFKERREAGFANKSPEDRVEMKDAYKKELAQAEATVKAAVAAGQWPPFLPGSEKSLTAILATITKETPRLAALPVDKMRSSIELTNTAKQKMAEGDIEAAAPILKEALSLWSTNELAGRLNAEAVAVLKEKAAEAKKAPATPEPKSTPAKRSTPKPSAALKESSAASAGQPVEEDKPFYMTLPGAISIVVGLAAILAGVNVFQKMKARKVAETE